MDNFILNLDLNAATKSGANYTFKKNVHAAVAVATTVVIQNNGNVVSAPCITTKRDSGTYVLTYSSTSFYVAKANPFVLTTTNPD